LIGIGKPRIFLCTPTYGTIHPATAHALFDPTYSADPRSVIVAHRETYNCSILLASFQVMLGKALDCRDEGTATHFCMLHSDVSPASWFLNDMLGLMTIRNANLISVVLPLKHHDRQHTSTAIGKIDDPWARPRHLTLDDCSKLPATFSTQHCCDESELLLVSTGLWLADLTWEGWDDFRFTTEVRWNRAHNGKRMTETTPEDWNMSRYLYANGSRYYATTAVKADHIGQDYWPNSVERRAVDL